MACPHASLTWLNPVGVDQQQRVWESGTGFGCVTPSSTRSGDHVDVSRRHIDTSGSIDSPTIPHIPPLPATSPNDIARAGHPLRRLLTVLGPGLITGASDMIRPASVRTL